MLCGDIIGFGGVGAALDGDVGMSSDADVAKVANWRMCLR